MRLELTVNGSPTTLEIEPQEMLVDVLRERLGLRGTKAGCREGECGACTVLLDGQAANSCLIPAAKVRGRSVVTIEGLGTPEQPHRVQVEMARKGAIQCGFCSPGFIMSGAALLAENPRPDVAQIKEALTGNLCRCTGYVKIIEAIQAAAACAGRCAHETRRNQSDQEEEPNVGSASCDSSAV